MEIVDGAAGAAVTGAGVAGAVAVAGAVGAKNLVLSPRTIKHG